MIEENATLIMELAPVKKDFTETTVKCKIVLMTVLDKESVIKKKVNVSVKMDGKDSTVLLNLVLENALVKDFVSKVPAFVLMDSTDLIAQKETVKIIAIIME